MEEPRQGRKMRDVCLVVALLLAMGSAGWAADCDTVQQYKMQSVLEYSGKTQFCNKAETVFTAKRQLLSDGKASYVISADSAASSPKDLSFVIDHFPKLPKLFVAEFALPHQVLEHQQGVSVEHSLDELSNRFVAGLLARPRRGININLALGAMFEPAGLLQLLHGGKGFRFEQSLFTFH